MNKNKSACKRPYLVTYAVTNPETYRIVAATPEEAEEAAFSDGEYVKRGDKIEAVPFSCEPERRRKKPRGKSAPVPQMAPAPWHCFENTEGWTVQAADNSFVAYLDYDLETDYDPDRPHPSMAHARLITGLPDLLRAAQSVIKLWRSGRPVHPAINELAAAVDTATSEAS